MFWDSKKYTQTWKTVFKCANFYYRCHHFEFENTPIISTKTQVQTTCHSSTTSVVVIPKHKMDQSKSNMPLHSSKLFKQTTKIYEGCKDFVTSHCLAAQVLNNTQNGGILHCNIWTLKDNVRKVRLPFQISKHCQFQCLLQSF